jgi:two-component system KDP operon response regulator KdpE
MEWQLLELLVININQTVPTIEIAEKIWPGLSSNKSMGNVRTYIRRLRKIIEPDPAKPQYLLTERGFGYSFVAHGVPYTMHTRSCNTMQFR